MNTYEVLAQIALGSLLGLIGQGVRIIIGLKKRNDATSATEEQPLEKFDTKRLTLSLLIGAVAGGLSSILLLGAQIDKQFLLTIITSGYAGTDFIEGALNPKVVK